MANVFCRRFSEASLQALEANPKPGWWTDLLAYRFRNFYRQEQPLVLAVRGGYLNAYVEGQSILKIKFDTKVKPAKLRAKIHHKYVLEEAVGQKYFYFDGETVKDKSGKEIQRYVGKTTLDQWVANAQKYTLLKSEHISEKQGVAVAIAGNTNVIDVEMGLPRNDGAPRVANRIDMVALQHFEGVLKVVFYEAKTFSNTSLRKPEKDLTSVIMQMKRYEDWLQGPGRVEQVLAAYRETCSLLIRINDMREHADRQELHPHVFSVAKGAPLALDMEPRLLVFDYEETQLGQHWYPHKLRLSEYGISNSRLLMVPQVRDVMLPQTESSSDRFGRLDEAEAILLHVEGPEALAEVRQAARR